MRKLLSIFFLAGGLFVFFNSYACAEEQRQITLQEAVEMAFRHSSDLRAAEYNIDKTKYERDAAAEDVEYTPTGQASYEAETAFNKLVQADIDWQAAKKSYQAKKDSIRLSVYEAYFSVLKSRAAVELARLAADNADLEYRAARLKYQVGCGSKKDAEQKEKDLASAKASLTAAEKALDDSYTKLNYLLGLSPDERPELTDQPEFSPFSVDNLNAEVSRVLEESPTVWQARKSVDQAKIALDIYSFSSSEAYTYDSMETNVSIAEQNMQTAEEEAEKTVYSLYNSIQQLEQQHEELVQELEKAQSDLQVVEAKFKNGTATALELAAARYTLVQAQKGLLDAECQHVILVEAYKTPWAYGG